MTDQENRNGRTAQDVLGIAADHQAPHAVTSVRAHHDEIRAPVLRLLYDRGTGLPADRFEQHRLHFDTGTLDERGGFLEERTTAFEQAVNDRREVDVRCIRHDQLVQYMREP